MNNLLRPLPFLTQCRHCSKLSLTFVPNQPSWNPKREPRDENISVSEEELKLVEKLSLLTMSQDQKRDIQGGLKLASRLNFVDATSVEPLYSLPSGINNSVREDVVDQVVKSSDIIKCAQNTIDGLYFVSSKKLSDDST